MEENIINVSNIKKSYKISKRAEGFWGNFANFFWPKYEQKLAADNISFQIKRGEMVGLIGVNGAGKSTLIKMLAGILYPDSGSITVAGYIPYSERKQYVANIGVVFGQKTQLEWDLPVIDTYNLLKYIYKIPESIYKDNLHYYVDLLDMKSFINQPVRQLSLGQRMRADIAASLLHSPQIIFFDEPTIGLDVLAKEKIRNFLTKMNQDRNITMIFTTHDMQDVEKVCNRLIVLDYGNKIYDGTVKNLQNLYGNRKKIIVVFDEPLSSDSIIYNIGIEIQKIDDHKVIFDIDSEKVDVNNILKILIKNYAINDISITDMDVEGIIRNIYED